MKYHPLHGQRWWEVQPCRSGRSCPTSAFPSQNIDVNEERVEVAAFLCIFLYIPRKTSMSRSPWKNDEEDEPFLLKDGPFSGNIQSFFRWGFSGLAGFPNTAGSSICTEVDWAPSRPTRFLEPVHAVTEECSCGALELGVQMGSAALQWQNAILKSWRFDECSWKKVCWSKSMQGHQVNLQNIRTTYIHYTIIYCSGA